MLRVIIASKVRICSPSESFRTVYTDPPSHWTRSRNDPRVVSRIFCRLLMVSADIYRWLSDEAGKIVKQIPPILQIFANFCSASNFWYRCHGIPDTVSTGFLGKIERVIGGFQYQLGGRQAVRAVGKPDADGDLDHFLRGWLPHSTPSANPGIAQNEVCVSDGLT